MVGEREDLRLRSNELAVLLFEEASDGLFSASPDGVYLAVNRSGHRLLGYDDRELVGKRVLDVTPTHDAERVKAALESVSRGNVHTEIWNMLRKDGSLVQLEVVAQLLSNGTILAVVRDIALRAAFERQVLASEAKLRSILFINRTLPPLSIEQVVGTSCYAYVPPESRARVERAIEHVFETRGIDEYEVEGPPDPDGVRISVSVRAGPLLERDTVVAATLCATDVTYRKQTEATRARLEEQLAHAQKMESVGQLAGGVAHDFNNLLTAVGSLVELSRLEAPNAQIAEYLDGIQVASARGAALTQQLLAFARKRIVRPEDVEVGAALTRLAPMVRSLVGEHVEIELELAEGLRPVRVDLGSLERVIMNLVVNARDAMPNGGRLRFETWATTLGAHAVEQHPELTPGPYAVLGVTDTGTGIAPEVLARLFEPFFTTKPAGEGTGIGLATVDEIVTSCRGTIACDSAPGRGTTFRVELPLLQDAPDPVAAHADTNPGGPAGSHGAPAAGAPAANAPALEAAVNSESLTILVVDDDPQIRAIVRGLLEADGYRVVEAGDGRQALSSLRRVAVDMILCDMLMPDKEGLETCSQVRKLHPHVPFIAMSGAPGGPNYLRIATKLGSAGSLNKPFSGQELLEAVSRARSARQQEPVTR